MIENLFLVKHGLSDKLFKLFMNWQEEYTNNLQHDVNDTEAWNALVEYLMELEKGIKPSL